MSYLLCNKNGFDVSEIDFVTIGGIDNLVESLENEECDIFLWEKFMLKQYVNLNKLEYVETIDTPWPCFMVACRNDVLEENEEGVRGVLKGLFESSKLFKKEREKSIKMIEEKCHLSNEDSEKWFDNVEFSKDGVIDVDVMKNAIDILNQVNVIQKEYKSFENFNGVYTNKFLE
jgi:sulfonate transport system substrate-binding protein